MKYIISLSLSLLVLIPGISFSQENVTYQKPPKEILDLVDVPLAPSVLMDDAKEYMVFLYRDAYTSIEELSQQEMRLAGLRIDPKTNIGSRVSYVNDVKIKKTAGDELIEVKGLPASPRLANFSWSPVTKNIAMTPTCCQCQYG